MISTGYFLEMQIHSSKTIPHHLKLLIYGDPGIGKTTFACSGQEVLGPALVANIEGGMLTMANTDVDVTTQLKSVADLETIYQGFMHNSDEYKKYTTLVIDSGTELQNVLLEEIAGPNQDTITIAQWGKVTKRMRTWMRRFRDMPRHVIVTALPRTKYRQGKNGPSDDPIDVKPGFTPRLAMDVTGYFDHVWYMTKKDDARILVTQEYGVYFAKTRNANFQEAIGQFVPNPEIGKIYTQLQESIKQ